MCPLHTVVLVRETGCPRGETPIQGKFERAFKLFEAKGKDLMRVLWILLVLMAGPLWAEGKRAGDFDYYVLSISWTPNFCERIEDPEHPQCDPAKAFGWTLHGLWPQYEQGWPSYCPTAERPPSRSDTAAEADIYGSSGLAWHQWKKHGTCSGLSAGNYFRTARQAYTELVLPDILRRVDEVLKIDVGVIEQTFLEVNPNLQSDQITVTCKERQIQEARICLTKDLALRTCGQDVIRDCTLDDALFYPIPQN